MREVPHKTPYQLSPFNTFNSATPDLGSNSAGIFNDDFNPVNSWERAWEEHRGPVQPLAGVSLEELLGNLRPCPRCGNFLTTREDPPRCARCSWPARGIEHWQVVWA